jgi:hypothetical protein
MRSISLSKGLRHVDQGQTRCTKKKTAQIVKLKKKVDK